MIKKIACVLMSILMTAGLLAGCAGAGAPSAPAAPSSAAQSASAASAPPGGDPAAEGNPYEFPLKEPVTFTAFSVINGINIDETAAMKKREEMTNVHWDIQSVMSADQEEKRNLLLASNDYPEIFMKAGIPIADVDKYGPQGIFVSLKNSIEKYGPNITKVMEERPVIRQLMTHENGEIYHFREVNDQLPEGFIGFINMKWLENVGLEKPTNMDELYNALVAFQEQDANGNGDPDDEIPYILSGGHPGANYFYYLLPYFSGFPMDSKSHTYARDGKINYGMNTEEYKEYLAWHRKLYEEGLIYPDSFTLNDDQRNAMGMSNDTFGFYFAQGAFQAVGRDRDDQYDGLDPFFPDSMVPTVGASSGSVFSVTDKCQDPDLAVAWIDYFYGEEGGILAWMGVEGENYTLNPDGTWDWILGDHADLGVARQYAGIQGNGSHPSIKPQLWFTGITDPDEKLLIDIRERLLDLSAEPYPPLKYSEDDTKTLASIKADIDPYLIQYAAQIVTGQQDLETSWPDYIATLDNMGLQQMMDIYNAAYDKIK